MDILTRTDLEQLDLDDDQAAGIACITCGRSDSAMVPLMTPSNPRSAMVWQHPSCALAAV